MQIVIRIPDSKYQSILSDDYCGLLDADMYKAIKDGVSLPKGHGRLIDADALEMDKRIYGDRYLSKTSLFVANKVIEQAPTIIGADKEVNYEPNYRTDQGIAAVCK